LASSSSPSPSLTSSALAARHRRRQTRRTLQASASADDYSNEPCTTASATRRALLGAAAATLAAASASPPPPALAAASDDQPTARVSLSFGIADRAVKSANDRTLGDKSIIPVDDARANPLTQPIVLALYGTRAPDTTRNFLAAVRAGLLDGTTVSRVIPGEYVQLGRQGSRRQGEVEPPKGLLGSNKDVSSAAALRVGAGDRPGTVALSLGEFDEDPAVRSRPGYQPFEFFITTGPGPAPRLNDANVAFGRVESGFDALAQIARVPTFEPDARQRQLNRFAAFIGDDRADKVARRYGRPLRAVVVLKAEVVEG
jgi:peptidyl-prolyl cis-trans isomerase B (cyclophilin B)